MPTHSLLRVSLIVLLSPLIIVSRVMVRFNIGGLNDDLQRCLAAVDSAPVIPNRFVVTLVIAEDHRSFIHPGVDPIAMLRVLLLWVRTGRVQGASTIEQQLVRVVLARYEKTWQRKLREQLIAVALSSKRLKIQIAKAYLGTAFYGSGQYGLSALSFDCKPNLETTSQENVLYMVARLKYPRPLSPTAAWQIRVNKRMQYIAGRFAKSVNSSRRLALGDEAVQFP